MLVVRQLLPFRFFQIKESRFKSKFIISVKSTFFIPKSYLLRKIVFIFKIRSCSCSSHANIHNTLNMIWPIKTKYVKYVLVTWKNSIMCPSEKFHHR